MYAKKLGEIFGHAFNSQVQDFYPLFTVSYSKLHSKRQFCFLAATKDFVPDIVHVIYEV
jgi:hypothetical protein